MITERSGFIKYQDLGERIAYNLCLGNELTVELYDRLGNGRLIFEKKGYFPVIIEFTEFNVNDEVVIEYNKLGTINRLYKKRLVE